MRSRVWPSSVSSRPLRRASACSSGAPRCSRSLAEIVDQGRLSDERHARTARGHRRRSRRRGLAVLHTRLLEDGDGPLTRSARTADEHHRASVSRGQGCEQRIESPRRRRFPRERPSARHRPSRDPMEGLNMRLTYRTVRVLMVIGEHPGASNREIAERSGMVDQGQISKLLDRLARLGLVENRRGPGERCSQRLASDGPWRAGRAGCSPTLRSALFLCSAPSERACLFARRWAEWWVGARRALWRSWACSPCSLVGVERRCCACFCGGCLGLWHDAAPGFGSARVAPRRGRWAATAVSASMAPSSERSARCRNALEAVSCGRSGTGASVGSFSDKAFCSSARVDLLGRHDDSPFGRRGDGDVCADAR